MTRPSVVVRARMLDVLLLVGIAPPSNPRRLIRCPLHADDRPSLRIFERGFRCFGCGKRGGLLAFVVEMGRARDRASAARWIEERLR